jgi:hypothetical protein
MANIIPKTITPIRVWSLNILLIVALWALLLFPFGPLWSFLITGITLGILITSGVIATDTPDWHGALVFDPIFKTRRAIFPGLSFKLPWEIREKVDDKDFIDLRRIISSKVEKEHPTNDPAENMKVSLLIHMRLVTIGITPEQAAKNLINFSSITEIALTSLVQAEAEKMFGTYYAGEEMEDLLDLGKIQKAILEVTKNMERIMELEKNYGISIGFVLSASNPDDATKALKKTPAIAEALSKAIEKLTSKGMDPELARRAALILDQSNDYNEERFDLNIAAPDLKNLQHVSFMGLGKDVNKKGGKK